MIKTERLYGRDYGYYKVLVKHPDGRTLDITSFRGAPTKVTDYSWADPFSEATASIQFPTITSYDRPGAGDLWWLVPWTAVTIQWISQSSEGITPAVKWRWEGLFVSEEIGTDSYSWQCKGALHEADNFRAAPFYPQQPVPYELLIKRSLSRSVRPTLRLNSMITQFPSGWETRVPRFNEPAYLSALRPWGVSPGQRWSGITTRATGSWDNVLTGHIQSLLGSMYTPEGDQWTVLNAGNRTPVLKVRRPVEIPYEITNGLAGMTISCSRDFSQSANVVYGSGTDLAGTSFTGAQVAPDGLSTFYEPFAALPQVHPPQTSNRRLIKSMLRKETQINFPAGVDQLAAIDIAATQIRRFADPGYTGSIQLEIDPTYNGLPYNRRLIKAGQQILVHHFRGTSVLFHITAVSVSVESGTVSLTVDTKFRDALTVHEVRARTRDALDPTRALQVGKSSLTIKDLRKPWSYPEGSGVIPSGGKSDATRLFARMPASTTFPWTDFTKRYPPSKYPQYYVKVSRKGPKANDRWQDNGWNFGIRRTNERLKSLAFPIKAAENGRIRLTQLVAVDGNGNVKKVRFHFSIYTNNGVTSLDMPKLLKARDGYAIGDVYPFGPDAFQQVKPNGEEYSDVSGQLPAQAELVIGWGTFFEPAGYSPGLKTTGGIKTGKLVDEQGWDFDTSNDPNFSKQSVEKNLKNKSAGMLYGMIFCDDSPSDTYFIGRLFTQPPGTG